MKITLVVMSAGKSSGQELPVNVPQFVIGRDPQCNLRPASAMISKRHCAILQKNNEVFLRDFDSTNGTILNDQPVKGEVPLKDGDLLKVGPLTFKVSISASASIKKTPPPKPRSADADEDAAAALLSIDDDDGSVSVGTKETTQDHVPGGSTVMDIPAFKPTPADTNEFPADVAASEKPQEKKPDSKAKHATGAAQEAAKAILDKMKAGKRK